MPDKMYNEIISKEGVIKGAPLLKDNIDKYQAEVTDAGLMEIPDNYIEFLLKANGYAYNGIEFFGTEAVDDEDYRVNSIVKANKVNNVSRSKKPILLLGRSELDFYVYNPEENSFDVLDRSDLMLLDRFEKFSSLFQDVVYSRG